MFQAGGQPQRLAPCSHDFHHLLFGPEPLVLRLTEIVIRTHLVVPATSAGEVGLADVASGTRPALLLLPLAGLLVGSSWRENRCDVDERLLRERP
jgi:hypothetical protein